MLNSILDDLKSFLKDGNMLNKIIIVNLIVFILFVIIKVLSGSNFNQIIPYFSLSSEFLANIKHPWTIITHMFVHIDLWHFLFNMLIYYWFGNIVGDLIGDNKILPLYLLGGLGGFIAYSIFNLFSHEVGIAYGSSASVMATLTAAAMIAPNYAVRLILLGKQPIKYIAIGYILLDMILASNQINTGGHIAHLGGVLVGVIFVYSLQKGKDLSIPLNIILSKLTYLFSFKKQSKLKVTHYSPKNSVVHKNKITQQQEVDKILEKIKLKGYDSLTKEERESLFLASRDKNDA